MMDDWVLKGFYSFLRLPIIDIYNIPKPILPMNFGHSDLLYLGFALPELKYREFKFLI